MSVDASQCSIAEVILQNDSQQLLDGLNYVFMFAKILISEFG